MRQIRILKSFFSDGQITEREFHAAVLYISCYAVMLGVMPPQGSVDILRRIKSGDQWAGLADAPATMVAQSREVVRRASLGLLGASTSELVSVRKLCLEGVKFGTEERMRDLRRGLSAIADELRMP